MARDLTRAEIETKLKAKIAQVKADLQEAGSPASLTVEVLGGGLTGWGLTRAVFKGLDVLLKPTPGQALGFFKTYPQFTKGLVAGAVGLTGGIASLAIPYNYPMTYPRAIALQASQAMLLIGLDRIVDYFPKTQPASQLPPAQQ